MSSTPPLSTHRWHAACAALALAATGLAHADSSAPKLSLYGQLGVSEHSANSLRLGVQAPWAGFERQWLGQRWYGYWDLYAASWRARDEQAGGQTRNTLALGITPTLRLVPQGERWFVDMGIGLVLSNRLYANGHRQMSTRYNFSSSLGVGVWLDSARRHTLSLRIQHVSNAGIKSPNPGEDFLQLRYAYRL